MKTVDNKISLLRLFLGRVRGHLLLIPLIVLGLAYQTTPLFAQKVYTEFKDEKRIAIFTKVSTGLVCQCGCNFLLSVCPHVDCGSAIPVRRFIENRILEGKTAEEILIGMEKGFGPEIMKDGQIKALISFDRPDLVQGFRDGFGAKVMARSSSLVLLLIALGISLVGILLFQRWRGVAVPSGKVEKENMEEENSNSDDGQRIDDALKKLEDFEK